MLAKKLVRKFSSIQPQGGQGSFNVFGALNRLKSAIRAPVKHLKRQLEPQSVNYSPMTNTTEEAFDEVAHEWQALIVGNAHDVNIFNPLEQVCDTNFGTVDNPHLIFTSDAPFRYVGCSGIPNEDDYESHEYLVFMLKEGPMQRCTSCGQVFKLVRLRNEMSPEMDYYLSSLLPYDVQEMGEMDTPSILNPFKMNSHQEYTQFETPSNRVYSLVNPDEHDRLLIDPAYRLERSSAMEEKMKVYIASLQEVEREFIKANGPQPKFPINRVDYSTLIDVEKAILKLDRLQRKVDKFNNRKFTDIDNFERREKRMLQRAQERWDNNYALYYGDLTEEEQRYRDYYETDLEKYPEDEKIEELIDTQQILSRDDYNLSNYDFQESYTINPEDDQSAMVEKIAFRFKYRQANDSVQDFDRKNTRMVQRHLERFQKAGVQNVLNNLQNALLNGDEVGKQEFQQQYYDFISQESLNQYKDYYESDGEESLKTLDLLANYDKTQLVTLYENVVLPQVQNDGYYLIPKRQNDNAFGFWRNFLLDFVEYNKLIAPSAKVINQINQANQYSSVLNAGVKIEDKSQQKLEESKKIGKN